MVGSKFTKFFMSFLKPRVSFSSNFASLLISSSVFFHLNLYIIWTKDPIKVQIFRIWTACMKINNIPYVIFQATSQFSFKFCIIFQCHDTQFLGNFLTETLCALDRKSPSMYNFSDF